MSIPSSRQPLPVATTLGLQPKNGLANTLRLPALPAPVPVAQTSFVVASDAQPFTVGANQTVVVTFTGIPKRTLGGSALQQQASSIALTSSDTLHFAVALQSVTGGTPSVSPQVVDAQRIRLAASLLAGNNAYKTFQAVIKAGPQGASGVVSGTLTLMRG